MEEGKDGRREGRMEEGQDGGIWFHVKMSSNVS